MDDIAARLGEGVSATTINRTLEVARTILNAVLEVRKVHDETLQPLEIAQACEAAGVACETVMTITTSPYQGIVDASERRNAT